MEGADYRRASCAVRPALFAAAASRRSTVLPADTPGAAETATARHHAIRGLGGCPPPVPRPCLRSCRDFTHLRPGTGWGTPSGRNRTAS